MGIPSSLSHIARWEFIKIPNHVHYVLLLIALLASLFPDRQANKELYGHKLYILGDSQACGVKPYAPKNAIVICKVGSTISQWNKKIQNIDIRPQDEVIIFLGSNDWYSSPNTFPITQKLNFTNCVFVGPPLIRGKIGSADIIKSQILNDKTCKYLDSRELNLIQVDGVHTKESKRWLDAALNLLSINK